MNKNISILITLFAGITCAVVAYFIVTSDKEQIQKLKSVSFDSTTEFILAETHVENYIFDPITGRSSFIVPESESFYTKYVKSHENLVETHIYDVDKYSNNEKVVYIFLVNNYYFSLSEDITGKIIIKSVVSFDNNNSIFPFVTSTVYSGSDNKYLWTDSDKINSFEDVIDFYNRMSDELFEINYNEETILVKSVLGYGSPNNGTRLELTDNYKVKLSFDSEGILVESIE